MFDILEEKWIPVRSLTGTKEELSLRELVLNAQEYAELNESDSILECAMYRFIFTFISDMVFERYRDEEIEDVVDELYQKGAFAEELLNEYIELCLREGTSFDLFDDKRPFMQNGTYPYNEEDIVSVAKLSQRAASGTNKLFQSHIQEKDARVSYTEALKMLLAQSPFNTPGGSGWGSNHYGAYPPLFSYVTGKTLYEMILFNIVENEGAERAWYKPYWRMDLSGVEKNTVAPPFSTYAAMHFPWRFTKLVPEADDSVRRMYHVPGFKIEKTRPDILKDPYATYLEGKNGERFLLCPKDSDLAWKNITGIFNLKTAPAVIRQYSNLRELIGLDHIDVTAYVTIVKDVHGTFTGAWKNKVILPVEVLDQGGKLLDQISGVVEYSDEKLRVLIRAASNVIGKEDFKPIKPVLESRYNSVCRRMFFDQFIPTFAQGKTASMEDWQKSVQTLALELFDAFVIETISGMEKIREAYFARRLLFDKKESVKKEVK